MFVWVAAIDPDSRDTLIAREPRICTHVTFVDSIDMALGSAEDHLLASPTREAMQQKLRLDHTQLSAALLSEFAAHRFDPDTTIVRPGAPSAGMLIVQRGRLTAWNVAADGTRSQLRSFGEFNFIGDVGRAASEVASIEVTTNSVVDGWWLSIEHYYQLRTTKPWLVFELHEFMLQVQANREHTLTQRLDHQTKTGRPAATVLPEDRASRLIGLS